MALRPNEFGSAESPPSVHLFKVHPACAWLRLGAARSNFPPGAKSWSTIQVESGLQSGRHTLEPHDSSCLPAATRSLSLCNVCSFSSLTSSPSFSFLFPLFFHLLFLLSSSSPSFSSFSPSSSYFPSSFVPSSFFSSSSSSSPS